MNREITDPHPYEQPLLTLALLAICALLVFSQAAQRLDLLAYDTAIGTLPAPVSEDLVIVTIDEKSLNNLGQWPWRRAIHAHLIDKLNRYNASVVAFDVLFSENDSREPQDDDIFARSMENAGNVVIPMHIHALSYGNHLSEIMPIPALLNAAKSIGHAHVDLDVDGLARGIYLNSGVGSDHWPALSLAIATEVNPLVQYNKDNQEVFKAPYAAVQSNYRLVPFSGPRGTYPSYSYLDVLADKIPADTFRDKVVLVGASAIGLGDTLPTPVTQQDAPLSGVEFHANVYSAIMQDTLIEEVSATWRYLLTFAFIMIPILVFPRLSPTMVMPTTGFLVATVGGFSYALLHLDFTWFPPINAVIGVLLAYPLWSWQRMRHLNRFLSNELERLDHEPDMSFRKVGQNNIERVFLSLLNLLKPSQYLFQQNTHLVHSFEPDVFDSIRHFKQDEWTHEGLSSWIQLEVNEQQFKLALNWEDDKQRDSIINFLNKLNLHSADEQTPRRYYEQISNRITKVRDAIRSIQDMRTFIAKGFEEIPGAVLVTDSIGNIVYCNTQASQWVEKTQEELRGKSLLSIISQLTDDYDKIENGAHSVLIHGKDAEFEILIQERNAMVSCLPFIVDDQSDAGMMVSMSDISQIRAQQREKNQLIDFLSHDVRSPLVSQLAMLQGLKSGRIEWHNDLIQDIEKHAKRSLSLSEQFLQITRAEQISEGDFYEFDLLTAVENSIDNLSPQALEKEITIELDADQEVFFTGNAELIERSITNLLSNAIKYSDERSKINIDLECVSNQSTLKIKDEGPGIAADELPFIFDRFRRQKSSEIKGEKGAGLGLNFVKVVAEKHAIDVSVNSKINQGSEFVLVFPDTKIIDE